MDLNQPVVVDHGSGSIRYGIAGEAEPSQVLPSLVGRVKHSRAMIGALDGSRFVGQTLAEHRGLMTISHPINHGCITNWTDLELLWQNLYDSSSGSAVNSEDHPVLVTEAVHSPTKNRDGIAKLLFETFNVPAVYFGSPPVLSLYAAGKTTGLALDVGEGVMQCVPVYMGFALNNATTREDMAGGEVTDFLQLLLRKSGINLLTSAEREIVRQIKDAHCSLREQTVRQQPLVQEDVSNIDFKLPDGHRVRLSKLDLQRAPELLFRPHVFGYDARGVHELVIDAAAKSDMDLRSSLFQSIVLSGGQTLTAGFGDRLLNELKEGAPPGTKLRIMAPANRQNSAWIGGSILANLSTFKKMWVTAEEYSERPFRVHEGN